jgi:tetrathionate reductase subunit B
MTTCMTGVRLFGDLDDPQSDIAQFVAKNGHLLRVLKREMNTKPRIFYRKA